MIHYFVVLKNNKLVIPKFTEGIKIVLHRPVKGKIKQGTKDFGFVVEEVEVSAGPASSFVGVSAGFLSTLLSFGIKSLYECWAILFMLALFPIKFLDYFFLEVKSIDRAS